MFIIWFIPLICIYAAMNISRYFDMFNMFMIIGYVFAMAGALIFVGVTYLSEHMDIIYILAIAAVICIALFTLTFKHMYQKVLNSYRD